MIDRKEIIKLSKAFPSISEERIRLLQECRKVLTLEERRTLISVSTTEEELREILKNH